MTASDEMTISSVDCVVEFIQDNFQTLEASGKFFVRPKESSEFNFGRCSLESRKFRFLLKAQLRDVPCGPIRDDDVEEAIGLCIGLNHVGWESERETCKNLEDDMVANAIVSFYEDYAERKESLGNPNQKYEERCSTFYDALKRFFEDRAFLHRKGQVFPGSPSVLSLRLKQLRNLLAANGIDVERQPRNNRGRIIKIEWLDTDCISSHKSLMSSPCTQHDQTLNDGSDVGDGNDALLKKASALIESKGGNA